MAKTAAAPAAQKQDQIATKFGRLALAWPAFERLGAIKLTEFPPDSAQRASYDIRKVLGLAKREVDDYRERYNALVKEHGFQRDPTTAERRVNGGGKVWQLSPERLDDFNAAVKALDAVDVPIAWRKIRVKDLGIIPLSSDDLRLLEDFLEFDEKEVA